VDPLRFGAKPNGARILDIEDGALEQLGIVGEKTGSQPGLGKLVFQQG
jgi:hypothetical protein